MKTNFLFILICIFVTIPSINGMQVVQKYYDFFHLNNRSGLLPNNKEIGAMFLTIGTISTINSCYSLYNNFNKYRYYKKNAKQLYEKTIAENNVSTDLDEDTIDKINNDLNNEVNMINSACKELRAEYLQTIFSDCWQAGVSLLLIGSGLYFFKHS